MIYLHGNPGSSQDWERLPSRAGEFRRAVALDMTGFGRVDKPEDFDYTVEGYASHLDGMMVELGIRQAHLAVHDFGDL
jgi:pimeloyl-ACP methyl ester carboxylesterase